MGTHRKQTATTETSWIELNIPRDRRSTFDPHHSLAKIIRKRHPRRLLSAAGIMNQNPSESEALSIQLARTPLLVRSKNPLDSDHGIHRRSDLLCEVALSSTYLSSRRAKTAKIRLV